MKEFRPGFRMLLVVLTLKIVSCQIQNFTGTFVENRNADDPDCQYLGCDMRISERSMFTSRAKRSFNFLQDYVVARPYLTSQPTTSPMESVSPERTVVSSPSPTAVESNNVPSSGSKTTTSTDGKDATEGRRGIGTSILGSNFFGLVPDIVGLSPSTASTSPHTIAQNWNDSFSNATPRESFPNEVTQQTPVTFVLPLTGAGTTMPLPRPIANSAAVAMPFTTPSASATASSSSSPTPSLTSTPSPSITPSLSVSPASTPSTSPSQSPLPTSTPSPSSSTINTPLASIETLNAACVCTDMCVDEYTRMYGGSCKNGQCVDQITEDCRVLSGPLECSADILTRGVCLNSQCVREAYTCRKDACDAFGVYTVGYSSTGAGFRRQVGVSEIQVTGCSTAFCQFSVAVQCDVQNAVGLCRKMGGAQCDIVNFSE